MQHTVLICGFYKGKLAKNRQISKFGHNFWGPIDTRSTHLTYILQDLFSDPPVKFWNLPILGSFWPIFPYKIPKSICMLHSFNFWDKNLNFGIWLPYIQTQLDLMARSQKWTLLFEEAESSLLHNVNSKNVTKTCTCFTTAFGRKGQKLLGR